MSSASRPLIGVGRPKLDPAHPDYLARRAESLSLHQARVLRKKQRDAEDKVVFEAIMKQLAESRLDHVSRHTRTHTSKRRIRANKEGELLKRISLCSCCFCWLCCVCVQLHRWRNAFDGTKQKLDRHLIKRLVSRAESRAAALDGGVALQPSGHLGVSGGATSLLTAQELSELAGGGGSAHNNSGLKGPARTTASHGGLNSDVMSPTSPAMSRSRKKGGGGGGGFGSSQSSREKLLVDDFAVADHDARGFDARSYDDGHHARSNHQPLRIDEEGEEAEEAAAEAEAKAMRAQGKGRRRMAERLKKEGPQQLRASAGEDQTRAYQFTRPKHLSGLQQSNQADIVIETEATH